MIPYPSLRQGLIRAWCPSLGASGLMLIDRSGRNAHGTLTGMAGKDNWQASGSGVALNFDGVGAPLAGNNQHVACGAVLPGAFTYSAWCYLRTFGPDGKVVHGGVFSEVYVPFFASTLTAVQSGIQRRNYAGTIPLLRWSHVCIVRQPDNLAAVFIDGVSSTTAPQSLPGTVTLNSLGRYALNTTYLWDGLLDDIRIYDRALTLSEIRLLASRRGIGLTSVGPRLPPIPQSYPIVTPPNRVWSNQSGVWTPGSVRANESGSWRNSSVRVNDAGAWTPADTSPAFDPRSVPGMHSWWDASDSQAVVLDGSNVSQLTDKSGGGRHATNTTTGTTQPSYVTNAMNGRSVARFVAANTQRLTVQNSTAAYNFLHNGAASWIAAVSSYGTISDPKSIYALFGNNGNSSGNVGIVFNYEDRVVGGTYSTNNGLLVLCTDGSGNASNNSIRTLNATSSGLTAAYDNIFTPNSLVVQESVMHASNATASQRLRVRLNGGDEIAANPNSGTPSASNATFNLQIGADGNNAAALQGDICEILIFSQIPTESERTHIRRYLAAKWGVTLA